MMNYYKKDLIFAGVLVIAVLSLGIYFIVQIYKDDANAEDESMQEITEYMDYEPDIPRELVIDSSPLEPEPLTLEDDAADDQEDDEEYPMLPTEVRPGLFDLEDIIQGIIAGFGGEYSVYVQNLDTKEYLVINNRPCVPASLLKLFNMAAVYNQIENGLLEYTPQIHLWLYNMIVVSCNDSYNSLLVAMGNGDLLGGARYASDFSYQQGFNYTLVGGTLAPSVFEDMHFANILTSVKDVGTLLEMIYRGTLVSEWASEQMLEILLAQQILNKIPAGLPPGTIFASKTGEIPNYEHDAAIIYSEGANFVLVIKSRYDGWAIGNIQTLTRAVYYYFNPGSMNVDE